ncbi:MAG: hypothetical protein OJF52_004437 [Nitrospira sp.]|nr:MAG: hypothetical protein OJF52_004437 [Nitrospira sp.]
MRSENRREFKRLKGLHPKMKRHDSTVLSGNASKRGMEHAPVVVI